MALGKTCKKLHVPLPGRGYWAKKAAQLRVPPQPSRKTVCVIEYTNGMNPRASTDVHHQATPPERPVQSEKPTTLEKRNSMRVLMPEVSLTQSYKNSYMARPFTVRRRYSLPPPGLSRRSEERCRPGACRRVVRSEAQMSFFRQLCSSSLMRHAARNFTRSNSSCQSIPSRGTRSLTVEPELPNEKDYSPRRSAHDPGRPSSSGVPMPHDQDQIVKTDQVIESIRAELDKVSPTRRQRIMEAIALAALGSVPWVGGVLAAAATFKFDEHGVRGDKLRNQ